MLPLPRVRGRLPVLAGLSLPLSEQHNIRHQGRHHLASPDAEGVYRSSALRDFWLRVEWLWQPPQMLDVLRELGLIALI